MSEHDLLGDAIERLEWDERGSSTSPSKRAQITRRTALTGAAAGLVATVLEACGSSAGSNTKTTGNESKSAAASVFGNSTAFKFVMVSHATADQFFIPTQNGAADACQLLGCSYQWTGSAANHVGQMLGAIQTATDARADGIATTIVDPTAFDAPVENALAAGIPVITYNSDAPSSHRLAYIGQDLYRSGKEMGVRIRQLVDAGVEVALFIATPGSSNLQPRVDGVEDALQGSGIALNVVGSAATLADAVTTIEAFVQAHPDYRGFFAVDAGSTAAVAAALQKYGLTQKGVVGGGFDVLPSTAQLLASGDLDFTIDQQPYLQGFLSILELYLHKVSQGLTGTATVDTGIKFLDKQTDQTYEDTKSRFEGTGTAPGVS